MPWRPPAGRAASFFALQLLLGAAYLGAEYLPMQGVRAGSAGVGLLASSTPGATRPGAQPSDQGEAQPPRRELAPPAPLGSGAAGQAEAEPPALVAPTAVASGQGLPVSPSPAPLWVTKADVLIVDLPKGPAGGRKMLLAQVVLMNNNDVWGDASSGDNVTRPRWLRACLASNKAHTAMHGHAHILRTQATLEFPQHLVSSCAKKSDEAKCFRSVAHMAFNWEKEKLMLDYLGSPENFSHVMVLDADAALVHHAHDIMSGMDAELSAAGKDLLITNEDWMGPGAGASRINGGLLFAANTPFTRNLFKDMLDAHGRGGGFKRPRLGGAPLKCGKSEQMCLNGLQDHQEFASKTLLASGIRYNRGGCVLTKCGDGTGDPDLKMKSSGLRDPTLEIMHFMGNSKRFASGAICEEGQNLTGQGPDGYGCAE